MTLMLPSPTLAMLALSENIEALTLPLPQVPCPVVHHFGPGVYMREIQLAADTFVVGRNHRQPHMNVMLKGKLQLVDENGETRILTAPQMYTSQGGRKCAYVLDDTVWLNVLATDLVDIETIEAWMFDDSVTVSDHYARTFDIHRALRQPERDDFAAFCAAFEAETGVDEAGIREASERADNCIPFGDDVKHLVVRTSPIEGKGLFCTIPVDEGAFMAMARIGDKRTPAGRFVNHSHNPNAYFALDANGGICLIARRRIAGCVGGDCGEEITVDYRQAVSLSGVFVGGSACPAR